MNSAQPGQRVWVNGSVYSPADPFATALLVDGPTVAWVGSDDAARGIAGSNAVLGDLRAAVVTPAFVAHHLLGDLASHSEGSSVDGSAAAQLPRARDGYGAVEVLGTDPGELAEAVRRIREDGMHALPVLVREEALTGDVDPASLPSPALGLAVREDTPEDAVRRHLVACTRAGLQAVLVLPAPLPDAASTAKAAADGASASASASADTDAGDAAATATATASVPASTAADAQAATPAASTGAVLLDRVLSAAEAARAEVGERPFRARGHRIVGVADLDDAQCERLASLACTVSCRAGQAPLRDLARAGVPVTLTTDAENPWTAVKAALDAPQERLRTSARAAFLALTRGAWRAQAGGAPLAGQLAPGAEATLAVWDAESVMVQQAQGTGASWSTDPRARTPVLPSLDDSRLPLCEATMVAGTLVSGEEPRP